MKLEELLYYVSDNASIEIEDADSKETLYVGTAYNVEKYLGRPVERIDAIGSTLVIQIVLPCVCAEDFDDEW